MALGTTYTGRSNKLYYNTGTYASPTWVEVPHWRDSLTLNHTAEMADAGDASSLMGASVVGEVNIEISTTLRKTDSDATWAFLRTKAYSGAAFECAVMEGSIATSANVGTRVKCSVSAFGETYEQKGISSASLTLTPAPSADADAAEYTVP